MTRSEHLLLVLIEECFEVAQRASKAMRFGPAEVQPGQQLSNAYRLAQEISDLMAMVGKVQDEILSPLGCFTSAHDIEAKKAKVEKFMRYSAECGTLAE